MAAFDIFGGFFEGGWGIGGIISIVFWAVLILVPSLGFIFFLFWWLRRRLKWNLDVEFKLPRSDGRLVNAEWGRGSYNTKRGVVLVKRKRKKPSPMKPFNVNKYLQGGKTLTVVQVGANEYLPVLNRSWIEMEEDEPLRDEKGKLVRDEHRKPIHEKAALLKTRTELSESKAWRTSFERDAKEAYSIMHLLERYAPYIGVAMILIFNFVGFAILWSKVS